MIILIDSLVIMSGSVGECKNIYNYSVVSTIRSITAIEVRSGIVSIGVASSIKMCFPTGNCIVDDSV